MVQNSTIGSVDCLPQVLGTDISASDLTQIQGQIQVLPVLPGTSFWTASGSPAGIYIVLAGKVRLFDLQGERVATLNVGRSFGESTLFTAADFSNYVAKAALVVGGAEILVGFIPNESVRFWWSKYPELKTHLSQRAQYLDAILNGRLEPSALHAPQRGTPQKPLSARGVPPLAPVAPPVAVPTAPAAIATIVKQTPVSFRINSSFQNSSKIEK